MKNSFKKKQQQQQNSTLVDTSVCNRTIVSEIGRCRPKLDNSVRNRMAAQDDSISNQTIVSKIK